MSSSHQASNGGAPALGSAPPLSTNPLSSEGQPLWEEGQGRGWAPRPAVRVWIPINYREVHFPCQGDWKEGRDGTLCACRWAIGHGLSQGRPKTRLDMLRKPHCHETYSMTWPLLQEIEGQTHDATKTPPSYTMQLQPQKH